VRQAPPWDERDWRLTPFVRFLETTQGSLLLLSVEGSALAGVSLSLGIGALASVALWAVAGLAVARVEAIAPLRDHLPYARGVPWRRVIPAIAPPLPLMAAFASFIVLVALASRELRIFVGDAQQAGSLIATLAQVISTVGVLGI